MPGRNTELGGKRQCAVDQRLANRRPIFIVVANKKALPGRRRMRQTTEELRVVRAAELLVGRRPRPVMDEVAVRVEPRVERQDAAHHAIFVGRGQVPREPAARSPRCTVGFQHSQKITIEERMARRTKPRPRLMRNGLGGVVAGDGELWH